MADNINNLPVIQDNLAYLVKNHGEIYQAYQQFGQLVHEQGGPLDEKTRWLIKVSLSVAGQNEYALRTHIRKALKNGCTSAEIEHAVLLVAPTAGFPRMMEGLLILRQTMDQQD